MEIFRTIDGRKFVAYTGKIEKGDPYLVEVGKGKWEFVDQYSDEDKRKKLKVLLSIDD